MSAQDIRLAFKAMPIEDQRTLLEGLWIEHAYEHGLEGRHLMPPLESGSVQAEASKVWKEGFAHREEQMKKRCLRCGHVGMTGPCLSGQAHVYDLHTKSKVSEMQAHWNAIKLMVKTNDGMSYVAAKGMMNTFACEIVDVLLEELQSRPAKQCECPVAHGSGCQLGSNAQAQRASVR